MSSSSCTGTIYFLSELTSKALRLLNKYQQGSESLVIPPSKRKHLLDWFKYLKVVQYDKYQHYFIILSHKQEIAFIVLIISGSLPIVSPEFLKQTQR